LCGIEELSDAMELRHVNQRKGESNEFPEPWQEVCTLVNI
jgi:hypothetical protein